MTRWPRITGESVLTRWMGMGIARINDGVVSGPKTLSSPSSPRRARAQ
jgi:hypothetical protein